jgi:3-phenylpropionate/cinnamic acid dioxygenase small subunit
VPSILYEDRTILAMRVRRLDHPRAHVLAPMPRTTHLIGNIEISADATGEHDITVESALIMVEHRDDAQRIFSGRCTHRLRRTEAGWRIAQKRVDLINCDGIHGAITIPF